MSFQDSAGGIVLDAVLTDLGRKKMAQGNFTVVKFALGDDEVDYSFYEISGGISDDTKIMTTPIMEAFAGQSANINHGLQNFIREDIIYYPTIKTNPYLSEAAITGSSGFYHFAVNKETKRKLESHFGDLKFVLENNKLDQTKLVFESGIDSTDLDPNHINKERFIINMGLYDKYFIAYTDNRFVEKMLVSREDSMFENDSSNNLYANLEPLQDSIEVSLPGIGEFHSSYRISAVDNNIIKTSESEPKHSNIQGPRSSVFALNFKIKDELTSDSSSDFKYGKFGTTSNAVLGGSDLYDFIDTTIYIQGLSSGATITVPIRIIRYAGT